MFDKSKEGRTSPTESPGSESRPPPKWSSATITTGEVDAFAAFSTRVRHALRRRATFPTRITTPNRYHHPSEVKVTSPLREVTFVDALNQPKLALTREHMIKLHKLIERLMSTPNLKAWYQIRSDFVKDFRDMADVKPSKLMELYDKSREEDYGDPECAIVDSPEPMVEMTASDEEREELYAPGTPRSTYVSTREDSWKATQDQ